MEQTNVIDAAPLKTKRTRGPSKKTLAKQRAARSLHLAKLVEDFVLNHGGIQTHAAHTYDEAIGKPLVFHARFVLQTRCGPLEVHVSDEAIFGQFDDEKCASNFLGRTAVNPFSGKYNFHSGNLDGAGDAADVIVPFFDMWKTHIAILLENVDSYVKPLPPPPPSWYPQNEVSPLPQPVLLDPPDRATVDLVERLYAGFLAHDARARTEVLKGIDRTSSLDVLKLHVMVTELGRFIEEETSPLGEVEQLEDEVSRLEVLYETHQTRADKAETQVEDLTTEVEDLKAKVAALEKQTGEMDDRIGNLVDALEKAEIERDVER